MLQIQTNFSKCITTIPPTNIFASMNSSGESDFLYKRNFLENETEKAIKKQIVSDYFDRDWNNTNHTKTCNCTLYPSTRKRPNMVNNAKTNPQIGFVCHFYNSYGAYRLFCTHRCTPVTERPQTNAKYNYSQKISNKPTKRNLCFWMQEE